jgi:hypothetical protein
VSAAVHVAGANDIINMNACIVFEVWILRVHEGLEDLFADTWIYFIDYFLRHGFQHDSRYESKQPFTGLRVLLCLVADFCRRGGTFQPELIVCQFECMNGVMYSNVDVGHASSLIFYCAIVVTKVPEYLLFEYCLYNCIRNGMEILHGGKGILHHRFESEIRSIPFGQKVFRVDLLSRIVQRDRRMEIGGIERHEYDGTPMIYDRGL